ncbi:hypothetical protein ENSA7_52210 [Enhygromyxa salina]|uniref:NACHT domain-containing protein n=1 Tax=Enhygromyxa salina TaxID=215803 RepID=A0A2S9YFP7_9BACT|nr:hypothetical protein ENSA7_52210 [Enhygromyxa salina]
MLVAVWVAMIALPAQAGSADAARLICSGRGEDLGELSDREEREVVDCLLYRLDPTSTIAQTQCCEGGDCCVDGGCERRSCDDVKQALGYLADVTNVPAQGLDRLASLRDKRASTYMGWAWSRYFIDALTNLGHHASAAQQPGLADALGIYLSRPCLRDGQTSGCSTRPLDSAKRLTKLLASKPFAPQQFSETLVELLPSGVDIELRRKVIEALLVLEPSGATRKKAIDSLLMVFQTTWLTDNALRAQAIGAVAQLGWRGGTVEARSRELLLQYMDPGHPPRELHRPTVEAVAVGMGRYVADDIQLAAGLVAVIDDPELGPLARDALERIPKLDGGRPELLELLAPLLEPNASNQETQLMVAGWVRRHGGQAKVDELFSRLSAAVQTSQALRQRLRELAVVRAPGPTPPIVVPTVPELKPTPTPAPDRPRQRRPRSREAASEAPNRVAKTWRTFSDWWGSERDGWLKNILVMVVPGLAFGLLLRPLLFVHPIGVHKLDRWMLQRFGGDGWLAGLRTRPFLRARYFDHAKVCQLWIARAYTKHEAEIRDRGGYREQLPPVFPRLSFSRRKDVPIDSPAALVAELFEARSAPRRTVIFGNAHTGKSQLARAVARELLADRKVIPIYVDVAAQWFETHPLDREQLHALVVEHLCKIDTLDAKLPPEFLGALIRDGHVVVVLDGVEQRHQQIEALLGADAEPGASSTVDERELERDLRPLPRLLIFSRRDFTGPIRVDRRARLDEVALGLWPKFGVDPAAARAQVGERPVPVGVLASMVENDHFVDWDAYAEALVAPLVDYEQPRARAALVDVVGYRTIKRSAQTRAALDELAKQRGWRALYEPQWALDHSLFDINGDDLVWRLPNFEAHLLTEYLRRELVSEPIDVDVDRTVREWLAEKIPPDPLQRLEAGPLEQPARDRLASWRKQLEDAQARATATSDADAKQDPDPTASSPE